MRYNSIFFKIILAFTGIMIIVNIYLMYHVRITQRVISNISNELSEVINSRNEYRNYIQQSFNLFRVPVDDVQKSFTEIICYHSPKPYYIVFIPSHACKACISTFFSEIKTTDINFENLYLISEFDDQIFKRLWMSYGYDKNKIVLDKYNIFKKSDINDKIVIMKFSGDMSHYDFLQYDLFLGKLLQDFINKV